MKKEIVIKDNAIINASYNLNLMEHRILAFSIAKSKKENKAIDHSNYIEIRVDDFCELFKIDRGSIYRDLKNACQDFKKREFSYFNGKEIIDSNWVQSAKYNQKENKISILFTLELIPFIGFLEERMNFTSYFIEDIAGMTSVYAIRLYELIISWKKTHQTPVIKLEDLRKKLGVLPEEYKMMCDFKKRVFDVAVNQINEHSNIRIGVNQYKKGRSIIGFSFTFVELKEKEKEKDPNTIDWVDQEQKPKREKLSINEIVCRHPNETIGKLEPEIYKMFGSKYHII